jgi:hypothetical protein
VVKGEQRRRDDDLMADVNAHVHDLARRLESSTSDHERWRFMCECGDPQCHQQVWLTLGEYQGLQRRGKSILAAAHDPPPSANA